jgi:hypothetical protein
MTERPIAETRIFVVVAWIVALTLLHYRAKGVIQ